MTDFEMYALLLGFFLPPVLSVLQQTNWSDRLKAVVAFLACVAAGTGLAYFQGDLTGKRFATGSLVILVTALATYRNFWKPTGISPGIETKTNL